MCVALADRAGLCVFLITANAEPVDRKGRDGVSPLVCGLMLLMVLMIVLLLMIVVVLLIVVCSIVLVLPVQ